MKEEEFWMVRQAHPDLAGFDKLTTSLVQLQAYRQQYGFNGI